MEEWWHFLMLCYTFCKFIEEWRFHIDAYIFCFQANQHEDHILPRKKEGENDELVKEAKNYELPFL